VEHLDQTVEIEGRRARIVGFTCGIRSFTDVALRVHVPSRARKFSPSSTPTRRCSSW
jgi:hypothetical protein